MFRQALTTGLILGTMGVADAPAAQRCALPGEQWHRRAPAELNLDAARLRAVLDWADTRASTSVAVYRHGCLAATSRLDRAMRRAHLDGWSMTKSVTSMVVGRAITLKLLKLDKPIGRLYPEADAEHARLTPRRLLTMTSGLHRNWVRDLAPQPDRIRDALSLPFDHEPGAHWEYQQSTVTLLADVVGRAAGMDVADFAQAQLFGPLGIQRADWTWDRDRAGHAEGWAHLKMRPHAWGRLGELMLRRGRWGRRQLISRAYVRKALRPLAINNAYGFLFWLNGPGRWVMPAAAGEDPGAGQIVPAGPRDMFLMAGMGEQRTYVIPSRDLVIVRLGDRGSRELDTRVTLWTGRGGELDHEIVRGVLRAVTDVPYEDPGPYAGSDPFLPPLDEGVVGDATDVGQVLAGLGAGPSAPTGCTPAGCQ